MLFRSRLKEAADIDAVLIDSDLPYPTLPDLLASLRADVHLGLLPVRVLYTPPAEAPKAEKPEKEKSSPGGPGGGMPPY